MTVAIVIAATLSSAGRNLAYRPGSRVSARAIRLIISRHVSAQSKMIRQEPLGPASARRAGWLLTPAGGNGAAGCSPSLESRPHRRDL
jgi:hypothetical protein